VSNCYNKSYIEGSYRLKNVSFDLPYLDLGVFEDIAQVLCDAVLWAQVLLCEVDGLLVGQDGGGVRAQELLLHTHVVIGNG
jgi:hypothetical protein